jgi:hypothetical protein
MTWDAFHRRGEVLRLVLDHADAHRDGVLPMGLPGVAEIFGDELALLGTLQLRWHTRLAGAIERELEAGSTDLESAVVTAWRETAEELDGVRAILDRCTAEPRSVEMARALDTMRRKDWTLMAAMAGKAGPADHGAARVGRTIEQRARADHRPAAGPATSPAGSPAGRAAARGRHGTCRPRPSLLSRFRTRVAA